MPLMIWHHFVFLISSSSFPHLPCMLLLLSHLNHVWLCATPQTAAHQAPLSQGFSRQEHWSGLPFLLQCMHACKVASVVSNSVRPHGQQPSRLLCPQDSLGKNTGLGCHFFLQHLPYISASSHDNLLNSNVRYSVFSRKIAFFIYWLFPPFLFPSFQSIYWASIDFVAMPSRSNPMSLFHDAGPNVVIDLLISEPLSCPIFQEW